MWRFKTQTAHGRIRTHSYNTRAEARKQAAICKSLPFVVNVTTPQKG